MKRYLITDPHFYTSDATLFTKKLMEVLKKHSADFICIRDKQNPLYETFVKNVLSLLPAKIHSKIILHSEIELAASLNVFGVHLPSQRYLDIPRAKALGLFTILSTHSLDEILRAQNLGVDAITFSPIFHSPGKGEPVGLEKLKEINAKIETKCFALGGITEERQIRACEAIGVYGFASIRYFLD